MSSWTGEILDALSVFEVVSKLAGHPISLGKDDVEFLHAPHQQPKTLPDGKMAVYGFWWNGTWLKIGTVGANSAARYTSQHYNPRSSRSNLAKSLSEDRAMHLTAEFDVNEPGAWIRSNTHRVNILVPKQVGLKTLALLEAFLHVLFNPRYEGGQQSVNS
jgi:hypothetical protein